MSEPFDKYIYDTVSVFKASGVLFNLFSPTQWINELHTSLWIDLGNNGKADRGL